MSDEIIGKVYRKKGGKSYKNYDVKGLVNSIEHPEFFEALSALLKRYGVRVDEAALAQAARRLKSKAAKKKPNKGRKK